MASKVQGDGEGGFCYSQPLKKLLFCGYMHSHQKQPQKRMFGVSSLEALLSTENAPIWFDGEMTEAKYSFPLPIHPLLAGMRTWHGWHYIAQISTFINKAGERQSILDGVPEDILFMIGGFCCTNSPESHKGQFLHAVDLLVPDGTLILAARGGVIRQVVDNYTEWQPEGGVPLSFITIEHDDGEFSQYCHVDRGSVSSLGLRVGSKVKRGQRIGTVAKVGWTDRDHLHFIVFRYDNGNPENPLQEGEKFKSLKIRFSWLRSLFSWLPW